MATVTDRTITDRPAIRIQLNGPGGAFPTAAINVGDTIKQYFKKNDGAVTELPTDYQVTIAPSPGFRLICYNIFVIREEPIPQE